MDGIEATQMITAGDARAAAGTGPAPTLSQMCGWLEVSRSGFYDWRSGPESAAAWRGNDLKLLIEKAFTDSGETYGYRRVAAQLARWGWPPGWS